MNKPDTILGKLERAGGLAEDAVLVSILASMIFLAAGQIIGRNFFNSTYLVGDELLRLMVLWVTLAGAVAASRADRHISITVLDRFLPARAMLAVSVVTALFTAVVCGLIAWFSYQFVMMSREFGDMLLESMPAWIVQAVLPVGFGLMAYRHLVHATRHAVAFFRPQPQ